MSRSASARAAAMRADTKRPAVVRKGRTVCFVSAARRPVEKVFRSAAVARRVVEFYELLGTVEDHEQRIDLSTAMAQIPAVTHRVVQLFAILNVGETPVARLRAAAQYADATPAAALIRCHRRAA